MSAERQAGAGEYDAGRGSAAAGGGESERADTGMWLSAPPPLLHHQGPPRPELQAAALAKQVRAHLLFAFAPTCHPG